MTKMQAARDEIVSATTHPVDRRQFLKILGGGIVICFVPVFPGQEPAVLASGTRELPGDFNSFLGIAEDGMVTCSTGKIEMGQGMACLIYKGTCVAAMGEVDVDKASGRCRVKRIVCAQDMGQIVNPEGASMQVEGCLMMGLGYALSEAIRFRDSQILDTNFDTYHMPRFSWMSAIETVLIDNPDLPQREGGEPAITCVGGLIANAIFDAIGMRVTELPITQKRVKKALQS